jgi:hypothetical protein
MQLFSDEVRFTKHRNVNCLNNRYWSSKTSTQFTVTNPKVWNETNSKCYVQLIPTQFFREDKMYSSFHNTAYTYNFKMTALEETFCEWQIKQRTQPPIPTNLNLCNNYSGSTLYDTGCVRNLHSLREMKVEMQRGIANIFREAPFSKPSFLSISTFISTINYTQVPLNFISI